MHLIFCLMSFNAKQSTTSMALTNSKQTPKIKIVLVGASSVGKTSISTRFVNNHFDSRSPTTLGAAYLERNFEHPQGKFNKLQIWDTTGQEKYRSIAKIYYKDAKIAIFVFDITDQKSLTDLQVWAAEVLNNSSKDIILAVVANKIDLLNQSNESAERRVNEKDAKSYAKSIGATYHRTSAKDNIGLEGLFRQMCDQHAGKTIVEIPRPIIPLSDNKKTRQSRCCSD